MAGRDTPLSGYTTLRPFTAPSIWGGRIRAEMDCTSVYCFVNLNSLDRAVRTAGTKGKQICECLVSAVVPWHQQQSNREKERCYAFWLQVTRKQTAFFVRKNKTIAGDKENIFY